MIDFSSYTVTELRQWIKEYQEQHNTSFSGLSKMRKAELYKLATVLDRSVKNGTTVTSKDIVDLSAVVIGEETVLLESGTRNPTEKSHPLTDRFVHIEMNQESLSELQDHTVEMFFDPEIEKIYNSFNRKQRRKFTKLCKGVIRLDDSEVTRERLASCF